MSDECGHEGLERHCDGCFDRLVALLDNPPYVDCICQGCPRKVPQAWASGMCEPCAFEDCEHTDGARAVAEERDMLEARVKELEGVLRGVREEAAIAEAAVNAIDAALQAAGAAANRYRAEVTRLEDRIAELRGDRPAKTITGAEFVAAVQAVIEPRTDEEVAEIIRDLEGDDR